MSNANTNEGEMQWFICQAHGLVQHIRRPTRGPYLLDLCLSDCNKVHSSVLAPIADHNLVIFRIDIPKPRIIEQMREVWDFRHARWQELESILKNISWIPFTIGPSILVANVFSICLIGLSRIASHVSQSLNDPLRIHGSRKKSSQHSVRINKLLEQANLSANANPTCQH